jgi:hypothetical protein
MKSKSAPQLSTLAWHFELLALRTRLPSRSNGSIPASQKSLHCFKAFRSFPSLHFLLLTQVTMAPMALRAASSRSATKVSTRGSRTRMVVRADAAADTAREAAVLAYLKSSPGVTAPFGDVFDPAGLSLGATVRDMARWRESEITHGRVAMLAVVGFVVGENSAVLFDGAITGPAINQFQQVPSGFWEPLVIFIGIAESYRVSRGWAAPIGDDFNYLKEDYIPGMLGFDPLGLLPKNDPKALKEVQSKEINNGRLAMIAIAGFVAQEEISGTGVF